MPSAFDPNHPSLQGSDPIPVKARSDQALVVDAWVALQLDFSGRYAGGEGGVSGAGRGGDAVDEHGRPLLPVEGFCTPIRLEPGAPDTGRATAAPSAAVVVFVLAIRA